MKMLIIDDGGPDSDTHNFFVFTCVVVVVVVVFSALFREHTQLVARQLVPPAQQARLVQTLIPIRASLVYRESIQWDHK